MPTPSARLGLLKPGSSDAFVTTDIANNWQKIDDTPGYKICTSTTRPSWTNAQAGMLIVETDTGLVWRWTGSAWVRTAPAGVLKTTTGAFAVATRTTDFSMASTTFAVVVSISNVVVPDGNRPIAVFVSYAKGENTAGAFIGSIIRSATANGTPGIATWAIAGDSTSPTAGAQGAGYSYVGWEPSGLAAGTYAWSFQIRDSVSIGGTSYIRADAANLCRLVVVEL